MNVSYSKDDASGEAASLFKNFIMTLAVLKDGKTSAQYLLNT